MLDDPDLRNGVRVTGRRRAGPDGVPTISLKGCGRDRVEAVSAVDRHDLGIASWDPERHVAITRDLMHDGRDGALCEGLQSTGWPVATRVSDWMVVDAGAVSGEAG